MKKIFKEIVFEEFLPYEIIIKIINFLHWKDSLNFIVTNKYNTDFEEFIIYNTENKNLILDDIPYRVLKRISNAVIDCNWENTYFLSKLERIEKLKLINIFNIENLVLLNNLKELILDFNPIEDLTPLENLENLVFLSLKNCSLIKENLFPLIKIKSLKQVDISNNFILSTPDFLKNLKIKNKSF